MATYSIGAAGMTAMYSEGQAMATDMDTIAVYAMTIPTMQSFASV
jgi:hypothetical protein